MIETLREEVAAWALTQIGRPAVNHGKLAGCAFGATRPECMRLGMDKAGYDCSGLVIAGVAAVTGMHVHDWPQDERHVRQMQQQAATAEVTALRPGDLAVFARYYNFDSLEPECVPGHIGIVVETDMSAGSYRYVHTSNETRRVELTNATLHEPSPHEEILGLIHPLRLAEQALASRPLPFMAETVQA
ncbi:MAG TPA: NlpC/P60 family protein [Candidatus Saccharimonadales bacterium]|nr:NlpC/P60 family protein [Candidatus Saccharimonadales bacterium]